MRVATYTRISTDVPSEELDRQVVDTLLRTYERTDLFERAIEAIRQRAEEVRQQQRAELTALETELAKAEASIERYMDSFESGGLTEDTLVKRIRTLGERAAELRARAAELVAALEDRAEDGEFDVPDAKTMAALSDHVRKALTKGGWPERKALMQALIDEVRATSRQHIVPTFRVPTGSTGPKLVRACWRGQRPRQDSNLRRTV